MTDHRRARAHDRQARNALHGEHWAARNAPTRPQYKPGDKVRIRMTGTPAVVEERTSWGDYVLVGWEGKFFPHEALERQ